MNAVILRNAFGVAARPTFVGLAIFVLLVAACTGDDRHYPVIPATAPNAVGGGLPGADAGVHDANTIGVDASHLPHTDAAVMPDARRLTDAGVLPDTQL